MGTASLSSSSFFPFLSFLLSRGGEENGEAIGWCWGRREGIGMVEEEEEELGLEERRGGEGWGGEEEGGKVGDREDKNNHPRHKLRLLSAGQTLSNFPSLCFRFLLSSLSSSQSSSSSSSFLRPDPFKSFRSSSSFSSFRSFVVFSFLYSFSRYFFYNPLTRPSLLLTSSS